MMLRSISPSIYRCRTLAAAALASTTLFAAPAVWAASITVDVDNDIVDANGDCSFREAVQSANTNAAVDSCTAGDPDGDIIQFAVPGTIGAADVDITVTSEITISDDVSIVGTNDGGGITTPGVVTLDGADATRLLVVSSDSSAGAVDNVELNGIALTQGLAAIADRNGNGGAIFNMTGVAGAGTLILSGVNLNNNNAAGDEPGEGGGAIFNGGRMLIQSNTADVRTTISDNQANGALGNGGGILNEGELTLGDPGDAESVLIQNNLANRAGGGIENNDGTVTINFASLDNNTANINGGAIHVSAAGTTTLIGAVANGTTVTNNTAGREGGGLWNNTGIMDVDGSSNPVVIQNNTASGDAADDGGGGIFNNGGTLTVSNSTITNNAATGVAGSGGGIFNFANGTTSVTGGEVSSNTAIRAGGGIEEASGNASGITLNNVTMDANIAGTVVGAVNPANPGNGGALHVSGSGGVAVNGATITNNVATLEGGGLWNGTGSMMVTGTTDPVIIGGDGNANIANGPAADDGGGGIFNNGGTLVVTDADISFNTAPGVQGSGGGIFNNTGGQVSVVRGSISNNVAIRAGGGIEDASGNDTNAITLSGVTLDANNAGGDSTGNPPNPGNGGALHVSGNGSVVLQGDGASPAANVLVSNNIAALEGGGLWNGAGIMTINDATVSTNSANGPAADDGGGGIFNNAGTVTISSSMIVDNIARNGGVPDAASGGGIFNTANSIVNVTDSVISGNSAVRAGGGIENAAGTVTLTRVTLGGADVTAANSTESNPGNGGGLHTGGAGTVTVDDSTVANNLAEEGGGLWNSGTGVLNIFNSTISGNSVQNSNGSAVGTGGGGGGGVFTLGGAVNLTNATIAANSAGGNGGGLSNPNNATVDADNSLIATNSADGTGSDVNGDIGSDFSLIGVSAGANITGGNNVQDVDPQLSDLANNGGPTLTHAIANASAAVDAGNDTVCTNPPIDSLDQRGGDRNLCDIGAYEIGQNPTAAASSNSQAAVTAMPGDTNVQALAFTFANAASATESADVNGFSGTLAGSGNVDTEISDARVYLDSNGNGVVDSGETELTATGNGATITLNGAASTFSVAFAPARVVAVGASENYLVVVDIADTTTAMLIAVPALAGGLALLPLLCLGGIRQRRLRWTLALATVALGLSACGGGGGGGGSAAPVIVTADHQFTLTAVDAQGSSSGDFVMVSNLPLDGPLITIQR